MKIGPRRETIIVSMEYIMVGETDIANDNNKRNMHFVIANNLIEYDKKK